jgi:hypothetical protein
MCIYTSGAPRSVSSSSGLIDQLVVVAVVVVDWWCAAASWAGGAYVPVVMKAHIQTTGREMAVASHRISDSLSPATG